MVKFDQKCSFLSPTANLKKTICLLTDAKYISFNPQRAQKNDIQYFGSHNKDVCSTGLIIWIANFCQLEFLIASLLKVLGFFCDEKPYFFHKLVYFQQLLKNLHLKLWYLQNISENLTSRHIGYSEKIMSLL